MPTVKPAPYTVAHCRATVTRKRDALRHAKRMLRKQPRTSLGVLEYEGLVEQLQRALEHWRRVLATARAAERRRR